MAPVWLRCSWFFLRAEIVLADRIFLPNLPFAADDPIR